MAFAGAGVTTAVFTSAARAHRRRPPRRSPAGAGGWPRARSTTAPAAAQGLRSQAGGACVVVVGHSDTVPEFIEALGGPLRRRDRRTRVRPHVRADREAAGGARRRSSFRYVSAWSACAYASTDVQAAQRRAAMGTSLRHSAHFFVVGSGGASPRRIRAMNAFIGTTMKK